MLLAMFLSHFDEMRRIAQENPGRGRALKEWRFNSTRRWPSLRRCRSDAASRSFSLASAFAFDVRSCSFSPA